ncbi:MAG: hypothetical protein AAGC67_11570 [Myxococcota bacterium]
MAQATTSTTSLEAHEATVASAGLPPELIVFALSLISVVALVVAPHRIGLGF